MNTYPVKVEQQMQQFYHSLSEKERRRYAAIEAVKLGWGGITYISQLFGCDYYLSTGQNLKKEAKKGFIKSNHTLSETLFKLGSI
jgi:hypothetical protein